MKDTDNNLQSDYDYSRATYYDLLDKGRESLEDMMEVARSTEHPRAYEVLSNMIKNLADVNDKLMDLNKKTKDIREKPNQIESSKTTNNLFVGSTADLQRLLQQDVIDATPNDNQ